MATARARSAPAARVDKSGTETALQDRRLANYEARLKQEEPASLVPMAVVSVSAPRSAEHGQMVHPGAGYVSNPLRVGEAVNPWTRHQEHAHRLSACPEQPSAGGHYMGEGISRVSTRSVPRYDETSDDDNYQPGFHAQSYAGTHKPDLAHPDVIRGNPERHHAPTGTRQLTSLHLLPCQGTEACHNLPLGACQTLSPSAFGSNAGLPR